MQKCFNAPLRHSLDSTKSKSIFICIKNGLINISELTSVHLPDVHRAIRASHHQVVIGRPPLDHLDWEEVAGCQHDAFLLPQTQQTHGVITGNGANTVLDSCLIKEKREKSFIKMERVGIKNLSPTGQSRVAKSLFYKQNSGTSTYVQTH